MKQLLIVSPNFPPVSAPDLHRVRMSLPHFTKCGWAASVLAVGGLDGRLLEPDLLGTVPAEVPVTSVRAWSPALTRWAGVNSLALRALLPLHRAGLRLIRSRRIDLVFFSTTMFPVMTLGRLWKAQTGVPFAVDMQDPWVNDYLEDHPEAQPPKYRWARLLHRVLEPFTMRAVDGVMAVSPAYHATLRRRYPWIQEPMCRTIPFGVAEDDVRLAGKLGWQNPWFQSSDGQLHVVYVGRGGRDLETAATVLFRSLRQAVEAGRIPPVRVWCIGTDYAPRGQGAATLLPVAVREGLGSSTLEVPERVPFFTALRLLQEAHLLAILGSNDSEYSPSKVYPYLLSGRPVIAILHKDSPAAAEMRRADVGPVITFGDRPALEDLAATLTSALPDLWARISEPRRPTADVVAPFLAPELTRQQCALFDQIVAGRS